MAQTYLKAVIAIVLTMAAVNFLIRGFFGPRAAAAYWGMIGRALTLAGRLLLRLLQWAGRHVLRFLRWTLREHWMFWLGVGVGVLATLYFTDRLPGLQNLRAPGVNQAGPRVPYSQRQHHQK